VVKTRGEGRGRSGSIKHREEMNFVKTDAGDIREPIPGEKPKRHKVTPTDNRSPTMMKGNYNTV